jgi:hypothetical protein
MNKNSDWMLKFSQFSTKAHRCVSLLYATPKRFYAKVDISLVKELRSMTQSPLGKCKEALEESDGDLGKAKEWLRKHGIKAANLKSSRNASQGLVSVGISGNVGVLVEVCIIY